MATPPRGLPLLLLASAAWLLGAAEEKVCDAGAREAACQSQADAVLLQTRARQARRDSQRLPLVPYPRYARRLVGRPFLVSEGTRVAAGEGVPEDAHAIRALRQHILETARRSAEKHVAAGEVLVKLDPGAGAGNREGYRLKVSSAQIELSASTLAGVSHAVQTLRQLTEREHARLPAVVIKDSPRFQWRGLHLDVSRHFFGATDVKQLLEAMASFKLNVFHWHLTDDQGWRLPVDGYPRLTGVGAEGVSNRRESYTIAEVRDVIEYARERHIEVVPEIDVPGHAQAAIAAYPELGNTDVPGWRPPAAPAKDWGVHPYTMSPSNGTFAALEAIFTQASGLFPSPFVHIGGDEAPTEQWNRSAGARLLREGARAQSTQSVFTARVGDILRRRGKTAVVWDEAQHLGGLPDDAVVMAWRSADEAVRAARAGKRVVNADLSRYYFDHYQASPDREPKAIGGHSTVEDVYQADPMPPGLSRGEEALVLGAQGQLWSEYFPTWRHVEYMAFPRSLALAERLWTPTSAVHGFDEFSLRLEERLQDLDALGVSYRKPTAW